jgi:uncharacterized protein (DUF2236 family)
VGRRAPARGPLSVVDAGLYGPGSEAWRLNREAMLLLGAGPRALLLQLAHPLVAEGVAQHSDFRADPWARLAATLKSYLRIVYGTGATARAEIDRLNALHRTVRGDVSDPVARSRHGRRYSALDPDLALWVHATLVDSTIVAYDRWIEPLSDARRAAFYRETLVVGRAFGIPADRLPPDIETFEAYVDTMLAPGGPIEVGELARELGGVVLAPPLGPLVRPLGENSAPLAKLLDGLPAATYGWLMWPSVGLLPARVRDGYRLRWAWREKAVAAWLVAGWRAWRPILPATVRAMPQAVAAERRIGLPPG